MSEVLEINCDKENSLSIFVVNLKKDREKKEFIIALCKKYGLQIEFIDAVDGRNLSRANILDVYSKEEAIKNIGRELSSGEIGCALSHKKIYKKMLDENINQALILEDDVEFDQ